MIKDGLQWSHGEGYGGGGTLDYDNSTDYFGRPGFILLDSGACKRLI